MPLFSLPVSWPWCPRIWSCFLVHWGTTLSTDWRAAPMRSWEMLRRRPGQMLFSLNSRTNTTQVQAHKPCFLNVFHMRTLYAWSQVSVFLPQSEITHTKSCGCSVSVTVCFSCAAVEGGGVTLSGGLRHSVALVRALVRDPQVIILDETTSKVDADVWHSVSKRLEYHMYWFNYCRCVLSEIFPSGALSLQVFLFYSSKFKQLNMEQLSLVHWRTCANVNKCSGHWAVTDKYSKQIHWLFNCSATVNITWPEMEILGVNWYNCSGLQPLWVFYIYIYVDSIYCIYTYSQWILNSPLVARGEFVF